MLFESNQAYQSLVTHKINLPMKVLLQWW